ncbi:hypothetical protein [Streptomyces sp. H27-H5]|uniref:hypothetical protein n=1 Tax=Streptomyces sp. H27-H5 TaxID=2996460 RepID=UPI00226E5834|nr:hypothetical protein [Streptomyces sp. H27-H5]MCY0957560.1 hypothetical protein [Streptomyces sp. H27-H5]
MQRSTLLRGRNPAVRAALRRSLASTALATSAALLAGLINAAPASAIEIPPDDEPSYRPISLGEQARLDRCSGGFALHVGGPQLKKSAARALTGTAAELAAATDPVMGMDPLRQAMLNDRDAYEGSFGASNDRRDRWQASNKVYWETGNRGGVAQYAPQFDKDIVAFTYDQRNLYYRLGEDGHAPASKAAVGKARELAAQLKGQDTNQDFVTDFMLGDADKTEYNYRATTSSDIARYLRLGGFMKQTPAEDSVEFRLEVEALKAGWGACDSRNPADFYRVMSPIVVTAHMEWEQEYATQVTPRNEIVNAEVTAAGEVRKATDAMTESLGQAWLADQILTWQKYWGSQPANASGRPAASVFTQATKDLGAARTRAADQAKIAATASAAAKTASDKANTAQNTAWTIADVAKTPRGRGLLFAQQSVQVAKASAAAAEAAAKATLTAANAAKATVADSKTLYALAQTQSHALNTEFRRIAAQEAAAQAKAAAASAAAQAKEAADNATKAKAAQATAEAAQETARKAAATAKAERAKAEKEKATAVKERQTAATERAKAQAAEQRAASEREAAGRARTAAEAQATTARDQLGLALDAEGKAAEAREKAETAEVEKNATASRAAALEAAAAAAVGTPAAAETREAATAARAAANDAAGAAGRARTAANEASTAAGNARAASTRADGAAERSRASADKAWSAWETSFAASLTSHAAAADAIDAADAASVNATKAEAEAKKAQAASLQALKNAAAARTEALQTAAWSAVTAGHAYATSMAASAARDSAAQVIQPANTAIAIGTAYRETDSAAAFAALVGQSAKTHAEQQAAAATAKADEATKAAATAKALADKAAGDSKLAAQAAAAAAADTAAALRSMAAARASAAEASRAADAAKKADDKTKEYSAQAGTDAVFAKSAAKDASDAALGANNEATEAEKSAANAHASADAATRDASAADAAATQSEKDAVSAETAAANANQDAKDAESAADRAEEEFRKEQEEARKALVEAPKPDTGSDLSQDEEALLLANCGQSCVDEFREAKELAGKDVLDWVIEIGGQVLLDELGYTDAKKCFGQRDVESCLWTLVNAVMLGVAVAKIPAVAKVIYKVGKGVNTFLDGMDRARSTLERMRKLLDTLKKGQPVIQCLTDLAQSTAHVGADEHRTLPKSGPSGLAAGTRAAAAAATPKVCVTVNIPAGSTLAKLAEKSAKNQQVAQDLKNLEAKLKNGNDQAGVGGAALSGGVRYQRARNGGRLFYRRVGDAFEIVAKSDKYYEQKVIAELKRIYG